MTEYQIYHNPRCSKSRQALALLQEHGIEPEQILYLDSAPEQHTLRELLELLGISARELLRKGEAEYKELSLADPSLDDAALISAMHNHPRLIERPIVVRTRTEGKQTQRQAVLGRPPENVLALLA
ncbi:arsenate reductase (glutaredoxin) [Pseudohongiella spirulinae]|uniref:Arsenate reductase n=1 Tax=Pseudohongiella spirulinae TaxID=1249552 RepID=A0A0S2KEH1_9GAMM|nr:arsenate reductase (glutaredoxin) [Pseudohongiella spirulinae]ALO46633.1 arsenate reductase [Pseudohongiella spirulinae]